jgi:hypothetical protein
MASARPMRTRGQVQRKRSMPAMEAENMGYVGKGRSIKDVLVTKLSGSLIHWPGTAAETGEPE